MGQIVTGANSGIGWHTALELARAGAEVALPTRSAAKGEDATACIRREVPGARLVTSVLDLPTSPRCICSLPG
ncbi:SDR family NAD(P)-dependent oxidoreductase [uncultured Sphingomonas sp.]|uniref:SDR family NAD(P)-dependent oxidoreductase n=1 Tax=uncultured Sphingomonas sp. TaxID=158754 RepID=UPI0035CAF8DD